MTSFSKMLPIVLILLPTQGQAQNVAVLIHGVGTSSCAKWTSSSQSELEGSAWFFGFWTGMNYEMATVEKPGNVGHSTDAYGLLGELKKRCSENPASSVINEAGQMFLQFKESGR